MTTIPTRGVLCDVTVGLGGSASLFVEVVDRAEGWVPRFTVKIDGATVGGDSRFTRSSACGLLVKHFGCDDSVAEVLVQHAGWMAVRAMPAGTVPGRW